jgi:hypothetical protein
LIKSVTMRVIRADILNTNSRFQSENKTDTSVG